MPSSASVVSESPVALTLPEKPAVVFIRCPPAMKQRLEDLAHREKKSVNALVVELLNDNLAVLEELDNE